MYEKVVYLYCNYHKMKQINPFQVVGYYGPALFCDREKEIAKLTANLQGGINTTLISVRRMGKTALLYRIFDEIEKNETAICLYIDLYPTQSIKDLTRQLATAVMKKLPVKKSSGRKFLDFIKGFRPLITYDPLTGAPEVRFEYSATADYELTVSALMSWLDGQKVPVYLAFDEFQMIASYHEVNTEALLRSMIQPLKNVHFVFCGSNRHMMQEIFSNAKRPFFASTRIISLSAIPKAKYSDFITQQFAKKGRTVTPDAVDFILEWTRRHTYYTQSVCNALYATGMRYADITMARTVCAEILEEQEKPFLQYRSLLTSNQWQVLMAIAKEQRVYRPQSGEFIKKHSLGTPATTKKAFDALMEKEMIYGESDKDGTFYSVYDLFLSRWLERQ